MSTWGSVRIVFKELTALYLLGIIRLLLGIRGTVERFHQLYYYSYPWQGRTRWLGTEIQKCPLDLWIYQEIIHSNKPDFIIESGTLNGGSAHFIATICDLVDHGKVITIDVNEKEIPPHPRITKLVGNSVSDKILGKVNDIVGDGTAMVVLDSDHSKGHVLSEMTHYKKFVTLGQHLIVEDTNLNGHPVDPSFGEGPLEAVREFLHNDKNFAIDFSKEKFLLSFNTNGYLKRISA